MTHAAQKDMEERGFTIIEVLVAVSLIGVALAGLLAVIPVVTASVQQSDQLSRMAFLANQRLEQVRNAAWTAAPVNDCLGISANPSAAPVSASCNGVAGTVTLADEATVNNLSYSRTVRVTDCSVAPGCGTAPNNIIDPNLRLATVTVTATLGTTATNTMQLSLLIARRI